MLLADTHIWYRWRVVPDNLSHEQRRALQRIERKGEAVAVSAISLWELAMMASSGRVRVNLALDSWIEEMSDDPLIEILPLTAAIAATSVSLTGLPRDPADRIIAATALCHQLTLLTSDERIREWGQVPII